MNFRFPSVHHLKNEFIRVLRRFPLTSVIVLVASVIVVYLIESKHSLMLNDPIGDFLSALALGLPLSVAFQLIAENKPSWLKVPDFIIPYLAMALIVAFYLWRQSHNGEGEFIRYVQWALYSHLLVSFAPFLKRSHPRSFWNFNYKIFIAFLVSRFFGGFLFVGLILALKAISSLLEISVRDASYGNLAALCLITVSTFHFLALIPTEPVEQLDSEEDSPKLLKIFCQYILVPLNAVYIFILYAYMLKIVLSGLWPSGMISWLVAAASILGVFALLMMNTFYHKQENKWMQTFQSIYYISIIPLLAMGLLAVAKRVSQYQLTEKRYALIILCLWLMGIALYNLISKKKNIILIPVSLFLVTLLSSFGPWGIYQVAWRSQSDRLEALLIKYSAIKDGVMIQNKNEFSKEDAFEFREALTYLIRSHDSDKIPDLFSSADRRELEKIAKNKSYGVINDVDAFMRKKLKVPDNFSKTDYVSMDRSFYNDYRFAFIEPNILYYLVDTHQSLTIDLSEKNTKFTAKLDPTNLDLILTKNDQPWFTESLKPLIEKVEDARNSNGKIKIEFKNEFAEGTFLLTSFYSAGFKTGTKNYSVTGVLILRLAQ